MSTKTLYSLYMAGQNIEGSGKASSYVRAINLLGPILKNKESKFQDCSDLWNVQSVDRIADLYKYIIEQQHLGENGIFKGEKPASYWRDGYCSAALKSYQQFLVLSHYEEHLWKIYNTPKIEPTELSNKLNRQEINSIEYLLSDIEVDFSSKEGKEKVREVKTRVNQDFFRKMILATYETKCCVTGLNIPEVLRASHIMGWTEDKENRLNPANGLCLSATYDAAFDRNLISFDEDYRMILSPALKEFYTNSAFQEQFKSFEGRQISLPKRFCPDQIFLTKHRQEGSSGVRKCGSY